MNSRKFVMGFLCLVYGFFWFNVCLWYGVTRDVFVLPDIHGDLTRLAFLPCGKSEMSNCIYDKKHIEFKDYVNMENKPLVDIVTIGDSFSNGGGGVYYQDYITNRYNKVVLNLAYMDDANPLTVLQRLINNGILADIKPKYVILETVERQAVQRFGVRIKEVNQFSRDEFVNYYLNKKNPEHEQIDGIFPGIMINANKRMIKHKIKYRINGDRLADDVYKATLREKMFTDKNRENILFYYQDDLWYRNTNINYESINNNLNYIANELKTMGIDLIVMIGVDKYDLYSSYIDNGEVEENTFMENFTKEPKSYKFINTKSVLRKSIIEGEKDLYWQDDTHWSWKGQQKVVDEMMKKMDW